MTLDAFITGLLVFARISGLFIFMPAFSSRGMPKRVRVLAALTMTILVAPTVTVVRDADRLGIVVSGLIGEIVLGSLLSLGVMAIYAAFSLAADLAASQMGLSLITMADPFMKNSHGGLGALASLLAGTVFILSGFHMRCLEALAASFAEVAPGSVGLSILGMAPVFLKSVSSSFELGVQLGAPIIALAWVSNLFVAVLNKIAPRMNAFFSMASVLNVIAALFMFMIALPWIVYVHSGEVEKAVAAIGQTVAAVH